MQKPKKPIKKKYTEMSAGELEDAVRYHNYLYFEKNAPEIADEEFDKFVLRLKELNPNSKVLEELEVEWQNQLSLPIGGERRKIKHSSPMLSLDKAYAAEEVHKWAGKFDGDIICSPKIDGMAVVLVYDKNGRLERAATRGNGHVGEEITENVRMIADIPKKLPKGGVEIRGEIYMRLSVFNKKYKHINANPRNLAAGAVKQKDPRKTGEYELSFFAYRLIGDNSESEHEKYEQLKKWGVPAVEYKCIGRDAIESSYEYFSNRRRENDYETDGVVYQTDLVAEQENLGETAHHPKWGIAYKYQGDSGTTTLTDVEWSVARSGVITPIGIVEPVELSGAMVSRVSLHNYGFMSEKKLRKGARVIMVRRGGVIPYLESVQKAGRGKAFEAPKICPSCEAPTEIKDEFLYCTNKQGCTQTKIAELEHFIKTVEIDGFGSKLVTRLYESGFVTEPADFYDLTKETLLQIERMGDRLATKLIRNIQDKRSLNLETFLTALGIRGIGRQVARLLALEYVAFKDLRKASEEELTGIDMIGPVIAREFLVGFENKHESIGRLLKRVSLQVREKKVSKGPLASKKFCFTGTLSGMSRSEGQKRVESLGAIATNSVTKDLDYLVVGSEGGAGSKRTKAQKLIDAGADLKIIEEKEFLKLI